MGTGGIFARFSNLGGHARPWTTRAGKLRRSVDRKLVDLIHPQFYRRDFNSYKQLVDRLLGEQLSCEQLQCVSPGILLANRGSSYAMTPELLLQVIAYNRFRGIEGEVLFFYEGLRDHSNALAEVLKNGPYAQG